MIPKTHVYKTVLENGMTIFGYAAPSYSQSFAAVMV